MRRKVPAGLAITLLAFATGCGRKDGKAPAVLQATPEAIVLIQDNEARCARIGQEGLQRLATAEGEADLNRARTVAEEEAELRALRAARARTSSEGESRPEEPKPLVQPSEIFKKYLAEEAAEELAVADAAQGEIQDLLPQVKAEAPPDLAGAVEALSGAHDQVCLAVRQLRRAAQYRGTLDFAENSYRAAEEKLQPLYTVSATDSRFALHKYSTSLEAARVASRRQNRPAAAKPAKDYDRDQREWQAVQQVQSQQENQQDAALNKWSKQRDKPPEALPKVGIVEKPPPSPEEQTRVMRSWHPGYVAKVGPVKAALANYLRLRKAGLTDPSVRQSCEALLAADSPLLDDVGVLDPPDPQVAKLLRAAFTEIEGLGQACRDGQTAETVFRLDAFERTMAQAVTALHAYSLAP